MTHRNFKLSHEEIEIIETSLRNQSRSIEKIVTKELVTNDTREVILKEKKQVDDLLFAIMDGHKDI